MGNIKEHGSLLVIIIILNSSSISQLNMKCENEVRMRQEALCCDGCGLWQHRICGTGIDRSAYQDAVKNCSDIDWVCIPCTAQVRDLSFEPAVESTRRDSWEGVGRKDQFLRTVERLIKPSQRKRHVIGTEKKKELGWRRYLVDDTKWPGTVTCCGTIFPRAGAFKYHVEKKHVNCRRYRLGGERA